MAGELRVDSLKASTGVLATQNGMTGIAKAWVNFNGTGTVAIRASGNVSSITDQGTGDYTVNFATAMPDANYAMVSTSGNGGRILSAKDNTTFPPTTTSVRLRNTTGGGADEDVSYAYVAIFR